MSIFASVPYRTQDIVNRSAPESGGREIDITGRGPSRAGIVDLEVPMVQHIEDIRNHRLPRYYEIMEAYSHVLHRWCLHVHHQVINGAHGIVIPAYSLDRMPSVHSVFRDIGRHLLSQNPLQISTAVQGIRNFLLRWSEHRGPSSRFSQSVQDIPLVAEFAELLLEEGMEGERMIWEPVVQLHTGLRLTAILSRNREFMDGTTQENARHPSNTPNENEADGLLHDLFNFDAFS